MAGRAVESGTAPSEEASSSARTVNTPSAVRSVTVRPLARSNTLRGAEVVSASPVPSGSQLGAGETTSLLAAAPAKVDTETCDIGSRRPRRDETRLELGPAKLVADDSPRDREARSAFSRERHDTTLCSRRTERR